MNAADVAILFEEIPEDKLPLLFRLLPKELAAETFVEMEPETQELLIRGFSDLELHEVVNELYVDDAVDIVEEMPAKVLRADGTIDDITLCVRGLTAEEKTIILDGCLINYYAEQNKR